MSSDVDVVERIVVQFKPDDVEPRNIRASFYFRRLEFLDLVELWETSYWACVEIGSEEDGLHIQILVQGHDWRDDYSPENQSGGKSE